MWNKIVSNDICSFVDLIEQGIIELSAKKPQHTLVWTYVNQQLKWEESRDKLKAQGLPPCAN